MKKIIMIITFLFICSKAMALGTNPIRYKDLVAGLGIRFKIMSKFPGRNDLCKEINSVYYKYLTKEGLDCKLRVNHNHMWVECNGIKYDASKLEWMGTSAKEGKK